MKCCHLVLLVSCVTMLSVAAIDYSKTKTESGTAELYIKYDDGMTRNTLNYIETIQLINIDKDNRILGVIYLHSEHNANFFWDGDKKIDLPNINYTYVDGYDVKHAPVGSSWVAVLYIRTNFPHYDQCRQGSCDNEIFYGYSPQIMKWQYTTLDRNDDSQYADIYNMHPYVIEKLNVKYKGTSIFKHEKKKISDSVGYKPSDWTANHGTYRLIDTTKLGNTYDAKKTEYQYNMYYPAVQHFGSYLT